MEYKYDVVVFVATIAFFLIIIEFFAIFLEEKNLKKIKKITFILGYYFIYNTIFRLIGGEFYAIFVNFFMVIGICLLFFKGNFKRILFLTLSFNAIWLLSEVVIGYLFMSMLIDFMEANILGSIISKAVLYLVVKIIKIFLKRKAVHELPLRYWAVICTVPICSTIIIRNNFTFLVESSKTVGVFESIGTVIIIMLLNVVVFQLYDKISEELEIQKKNIVFEQQIALIGQQVAEREEAMYELKKSRHDMKNHFICLKEFVARDKKEDFYIYIDELLKETGRNEFEIASSGNIVIDSLINNKFNIARKMNIKFDVRLDIPYILPYKNTDLCIILGNALDNAIEALQKVDEEKRIIIVRMSYPQENLIIMVKNRFEGEIELDRNGLIHTTKEDKRNHGIGISSIRKAASKYDGDVSMTVDEHNFILKVLLYNTQ